jgi:hypothetical protein
MAPIALTGSRKATFSGVRDCVYVTADRSDLALERAASRPGSGTPTYVLEDGRLVITQHATGGGRVFLVFTTSELVAFSRGVDDGQFIQEQQAPLARLAQGFF